MSRSGLVRIEANVAFPFVGRSVHINLNIAG